MNKFRIIETILEMEMTKMQRIQFISRNLRENKIRPDFETIIAKKESKINEKKIRKYNFNFMRRLSIIMGMS